MIVHYSFFTLTFKDFFCQIDLPLQGPTIVNVHSTYHPGEWVSLNCTSAPSNPSAVLYWYIDGEFVSFMQMQLLDYIMSTPFVKCYFLNTGSRSLPQEIQGSRCHRPVILWNHSRRNKALVLRPASASSKK